MMTPIIFIRLNSKIVPSKRIGAGKNSPTEGGLKPPPSPSAKENVDGK
jgi:hypothetical protein